MHGGAGVTILPSTQPVEILNIEQKIRQNFNLEL